jgi:hypothetical protein
MNAHKFSSLVGSDFVPYSYANAWAVEKTNGADRLVIAPSSDHVELMTKLAGVLPEPFGILYVLLVSRRDNDLGRYQCSSPCNREEVESFLREFKEYFESDGRHHIWVASIPSSATLVYDQHDVIYAYGPLAQFKKVLDGEGLRESPISFPAPHAHNYNPQFDEQEQRVLNYWDWRKSPLTPDDEA